MIYPKGGFAMQRVFVRLTNEARAVLIQQSIAEHRHPSDHAALLVTRALGLNDTAPPPSRMQFSASRAGRQDGLTIVRDYEPDHERCVSALLSVLAWQPQGGGQG
jgi:hypothetical protein